MLFKEALPYLAAIIASATGLYLAVATRKKDEANAADSLSNTAQKVLDMQSRQLERMEKDKQEAEEYAIYLVNGMYRLVEQLEDIGVHPVFKPKAINKYKKTPK